MSSPLKTYRVYCYDSVHRVVTADLIKAESDDVAISSAEAAGFGSKCEVWDGKRLVAQLQGERSVG